MVYKWKFQPKGNVPAQVAGECIEEITRKHKGKVLPKMIVQAARSKRHPLHNCFEWDDSLAAERYREQQAQYVLVQIVVVQEKGKNEKPLRVRAFVSVKEDENVHYTSLNRAMGRPELRQQLIMRALAELQILKKKYESLKELSAIFDAISSVEKKLKQRRRRKAG